MVDHLADDPFRLEAIVLAAGSGRRFGGGKLLTPWRGGRLIDGALAAAFAAPVWRVTIITGADPNVGAIAAAYAHRVGQGSRLRVAYAATHKEGMSASLQTGLAALAEDCGGVFVFLGDMPLIPHEILPGLADALARGAVATAPSHSGIRGHPVLLGRSLFVNICQLVGDTGARGLLQGLDDSLVLVETDNAGVVFDIDTVADLD